MKAFHIQTISLVWTNKVLPFFIMNAIWRKGRRYFINFLSNAVVCLIFYCLIRIKKFKIHPLWNTGTYISETINCRTVFMIWLFLFVYFPCITTTVNLRGERLFQIHIANVWNISKIPNCRHLQINKALRLSSLMLYFQIIYRHRSFFKVYNAKFNLDNRVVVRILFFIPY